MVKWNNHINTLHRFIYHTTSNKIQGDQKVYVHLMITVQKTLKNILNIFNNLPWNIRNVNRAVLNTVFENTVRCVNKCLETGGGQSEH
jgi:hypothetical protein